MKTKLYALPRRKVFDACKKALRECECSIVSSDYTGGTIAAKKDGGLLSFGHKISVKLNTTKTKRIKVAVESASTGPQIVDWGTNASFEEEFVETLTDLL